MWASIKQISDRFDDLFSHFSWNFRLIEYRSDLIHQDSIQTFCLIILLRHIRDTRISVDLVFSQIILKFLIYILALIIDSQDDDFSVIKTLNISLKNFECVQSLILFSEQMYSDDRWSIISKSHIISKIVSSSRRWSF